jgi:hypothetical protein
MGFLREVGSFGWKLRIFRGTEIARGSSTKKMRAFNRQILSIPSKIL